MHLFDCVLEMNFGRPTSLLHQQHISISSSSQRSWSLNAGMTTVHCYQRVMLVGPLHSSWLAVLDHPVHTGHRHGEMSRLTLAGSCLHHNSCCDTQPSTTALNLYRSAQANSAFHSLWDTQPSTLCGTVKWVLPELVSWVNIIQQDNGWK